MRSKLKTLLIVVCLPISTLYVEYRAEIFHKFHFFENAILNFRTTSQLEEDSIRYHVLAMVARDIGGEMFFKVCVKLQLTEISIGN